MGSITANLQTAHPLTPEQSMKFVELLTSHQRKLYGYIATMLLGDSASADVLQDTNLDLWMRAGDFDFNRPFLPWAFGFARQKVLAFRRSHCRSRLVFCDEAMDMIDDACMELAAEADDRLVALRDCVKKLSTQQSELVRERYVAKTSVRMIAARLCDSAQNISSRLHRIRKLLGKCIESSLAAKEH